MLKNGKILWENQMEKIKRKTKASKRSLRLNASNVGKRGTLPPNAPQRKKVRRSCKSYEVT